MAPKNQSTTSSPNQSSLTSVNNGRTVSQNTFNNGSSETSKSFGDIATCDEVLTNHDDQKESENDVKNITNCESSNVDSQWVSSETKSEQSDKEDIITEPKQENKDIPEEDENDGAVKSYDHKVVPLQPFKSLQEIQEVLKEEEEEFDSAEESDDDSFSVPDVKDEDLRMFGMKDREVSESIEALENGTFAPVDLLRLIKILGNEIEHCEIELKDELEKRKRYKIDHSRRTHNYDQFIITFLAMLAEQGKLGDLVKEQLQPTRKRPHPHPTNSRTKSANSKKSDNKISPNNSGKKRGRKKKAKGKRKR